MEIYVGEAQIPNEIVRDFFQQGSLAIPGSHGDNQHINHSTSFVQTKNYPVIQWMGWWQILQDSMVFTMKYRAFLWIFP